MRNDYFKNYMRLLRSDRTGAESMGYAVLQMTDRQLVKLINWYIDEGLATVNREGGYISFGACWKYPISKYEEVSGVKIIL